MRNAGLDEAQGGIKIAGRNINNVRYADATERLPFHFSLSCTGEGNGSPLHNGGVICVSEVIDISPGNLDFSLGFIQPSILHDVLYI